MSKTLVTFLLDKSGSMASIKHDTMAAFNTYLDTMRDGKNIDFSLLQFDTNGIVKTCVNVPVAQAPVLSDDNYKPDAGTPLIDAAVEAIHATEAAMNKRKEGKRAPKVVVCIQTDGQENSSNQHTWDELTELVKEKTAAGWQFNFMGAGIDAYEQGARMGISVGSTMSYDSADAVATAEAFTSSGLNTRSFAAGLSANTNYSLRQKAAAGDKFVPGSHGATQPPKRWPLPQTPFVSKPKSTPRRKPIVDKISLD